MPSQCFSLFTWSVAKKKNCVWKILAFRVFVRARNCFQVRKSSTREICALCSSMPFWNQTSAHALPFSLFCCDALIYLLILHPWNCPVTIAGGG